MKVIQAKDAEVGDDEIQETLEGMELQEVLKIVCQDGVLYFVKTGERSLDVFDAGENGEGLQ